MKKFIKRFLIAAIVVLQIFIVFVMDGPIARAVVGDHIGLDCGQMFLQGVNMFMERKHSYNVVLFGSSMILVVMLLMAPRKVKAE